MYSKSFDDGFQLGFKAGDSSAHACIYVIFRDGLSSDVKESAFNQILDQFCADGDEMVSKLPPHLTTLVLNPPMQSDGFQLVFDNSFTCSQPSEDTLVLNRSDIQSSLFVKGKLVCNLEVVDETGKSIASQRIQIKHGASFQSLSDFILQDLEGYFIPEFLGIASSDELQNKSLTHCEWNGVPASLVLSITALIRPKLVITGFVQQALTSWLKKGDLNANTKLSKRDRIILTVFVVDGILKFTPFFWNGLTELEMSIYYHEIDLQWQKIVWDQLPLPLHSVMLTESFTF